MNYKDNCRHTSLLHDMKEQPSVDVDVDVDVNINVNISKHKNFVDVNNVLSTRLCAKKF